MAGEYLVSKKYHEISMLAGETAGRVSKNGKEWTKYLTTAARLYKYPFEDQMLIYAQRPDAKACATMEIWNEKMFCWVNRGAKGIALFDRESERPRLKYVFDVSNVHKSRRIGKDPYLWELREEHKDVVLAQLEKTYGATNKENSFEGRLMEIARRIAEDYYTEILPDLLYSKEGSFLEELDELNVGLRLRETLSASIAYTILSRCGADMDLWKDDLNFDYISEFNTSMALSVVGNATTDMCKPRLMEIGKTVAAYDRQIARNKAKEKANAVQTDTNEKNPEKVLANIPDPRYNALKRESENEPQTETTTNHIETEGIAHGTDIREERGLSDTEPGAGQRAGGTADQVRADAEELSEGTPEGDLQRAADDGKTERALSGDTEAGRGADGLPDGADGESRGSGRSTESVRSDEMGGEDEQHQELSGGDRADGAGVQPLSSEEQQNKEAEEPDNGEDSLSGSFLDNPDFAEKTMEVQKGILCSDSFLIHKRPEIAGYFAMETDTRLQTEYFKNSFHFGIYYALNVAGTSVGFHANEEGLHINMSGKAGAENETLLSWEDARFLVNSYMEDDVYLLPGEKAEQIDTNGMYQQLDLFSLFSEQVGSIAVKEAEQGIIPAEKISPESQKEALPKEQLDTILQSGGGRDNSRKRIYAKYQQGKTPEEMAEFLKKEYGTTGKGFEFDGKQVSVWFNEQGMTVGYGTSALERPAFTMNWQEIEMGIRSLVEDGAYIGANEIYLMDEVNRGNIATHLFFFFRDGMGELPEGLELNAGNYPDSHARILELLSTTEGIDLIASHMDKAFGQLERGEKKLRFRSVMSKEELRAELDNLLLEKKTFPVSDHVEVKKEDFITQDEIDHRLGGGSGYQHGSFRIYDYFMEGHDSKEAAAFLKKEYGTGGSTHALAGADHSYENHDAKGISLEKGSIMEPYTKILLSWKVVEKRIRKLIEEDKYLSPKGKETYAEYKEEQAQKELEKAQAKLERDTKVSCKDAIDRTIAENFDGYRLPKGTAEGVIKEYGIERVSYVLANTIMHRRQEERISPENKEWAMSIEPYAMYESRDIVAASHPAVLNGFINQARRYIEQEKELAAQAEAEQAQEPEQNDVSDISEGELDWHIVHDMDDDNGQPTEWSAKLPNGEFLWIDKETEGYALYNTHMTDASPVSVSETLDGAKESGEDYAFEIAHVEEVEKITVALESTEDFSEPGIGFYTHQYADGREGVRYRLVTMGENGLLVPYPEHNRFFINRELAQEYIDNHADLIDVIGYDEMVYGSMRKQSEYKREQTRQEIAPAQEVASAERQEEKVQPEQDTPTSEKLTDLEKKAVEIAKGYENLPLTEKIGVIARTFGCTSGKIETSPCTGKWRGTSDISIRLDSGASLFVGNYRTPQAKTAKVQNECVNAALVRFNPEIVAATKEAAIGALKEREAKDNEIAAQKGLKPYTLLNVEISDGTDDNGGYFGWYYVTLAVDGKIHAHLETGLNYEIAKGKISENSTRENYFAAGALKETDVDYVFNNVGFSSTDGSYSLPISNDVLERAEKTLAQRREAAEWTDVEHSETVDGQDTSGHDVQKSEDTISIDGQECVKTDEWKAGDNKYVLGNSVEDSDFFYAEVNGDTHFEYDHRPDREEVEDDFIDLEAMRDIDRHEAQVFSRFEGSDDFPDVDADEKPLTADDIQNLVLINREYFATSRTTVYDFECDIRGEHDSLQYTLEYHDDGEGFTIHTEKDDIWERMPEPELERLEGILSREAVYFKYHEKIAGTESLADLKELEYEIMEDESPEFPAVSERVWKDFSQKEHELSAPEQETSGHDVQKQKYRIGVRVYLDNKPYEITRTDDWNVEIMDRSLYNPPRRLESWENFEKLLRQDERNAHLFTPEEKEPEKKSPAKQAEPKIDKSGAVNFYITDDALGIGGAKEKFRRNVEAIRTLEAIESENRIATPEEQKILSQYVGWGGLADAFDESKSAWAGEYQELKSLLSETEYASARESTLNAHYTSPVIIRSIYEALEKMGFEKGNVLEPAMGIGNFFGMLPEKMQESRLYGVELDGITGRIAKQLYPKANIKISGFEKTDYPNDFFDVAVGNVPFGQYKVADRQYDKNNFLIHDYFFAKTLDKVRPGGVVAFVTSKGTMDKKSPEVRKYLAQRAELLGAVRLPNTAFKENAGTEVTSDILFLKKRDRVMDLEPDWVHLSEDENGIAMNSYFAERPEMIVGKMEMVSGPYGMESTCQPDTTRPFAEQLREAISRIDGEFEEVELDELEDGFADQTIPADPDVKNYSYTLVDDKVYYRENSVMKPVDMKDSMLERIKGMIAIRNCTQELINVQLQEYPDTVIKEKQAELNALYDAFSKKYGLINSQTNKRAFNQDSSYCLLCSLEKTDEEGKFVGKADMFTKRTIKKAEVVTSVDTATEALAVSLSEKARIDLDYMAELSGKDIDTIKEELTGVIFQNPVTDKWETADEYLSGNVRDKLETAKVYAENHPEFAVNVQALTQVQPKELDASEIEVRIGATWVKAEYLEDFMRDIFETPQNLLDRNIMGVQFSDITGQWNVKGKNADYGNSLVNMTYGTSRRNAYQILEDSLNLKDSRVYDTVVEDGKEKRVLNKKETTLAAQKQDTIREAFKDWVFRDPDRRQDLVAKYNQLFNSTRPREYDGAHLKFPGMTPDIELKPHQKNAVAHVLYGDNTLLAHCVGAGKTFEMTAAAMESKRLGLCQKSLFVVPNHLTEQWASDFLRLYPGANILAATKKDFEPANRKKFCSRIATGDYDAVIIGHSQFEKIPLSIERQEAMIERQISEIELAIEQAKADNGERYTIKQMEKTRKSLSARLEKLNDATRKDNVVTFEQLGVDRLFVDESHNYKNLFLYTKMRNVAGIAQTEAQKSSDMFAKCQYLDEITGGKGVTFATGTPISNSMTELYTNMRYLQYSTLQKLGLGHFDSWASSFGETQTAIELAPEGTGYRAKTRFAKFFNLPELISLFKESADIQTPDMLNLPVPEAEYENVVLKPSEYQQDMVSSLADRAEAVRNRLVEPYQDNMLKITNDGRKLALDQRLINDVLPDSDTSKAAMCVEKAFEIWEQTKEKKSTQLIFCDLSTPKGDGTFNVYEDIKNKLIEKGVPPEEIAFIHEANTELRKAELFGKVRSGQVRFLLGSTQKMGAGTNVQDRLIALHHLDVPWRPSDIEQQEGRILRQGNLNPKVKIFRYVTEGTFDSYSWQLIENKQKFIGQIMTSKSPVRSCEDVDEAALTYAEVKALATGNPYIKEKMDLDIQVSKLKLMKGNHTSQKYRLEDDILKRYPQQIAILKERISGMTVDIQTAKTNLPADKEQFVMKVGDKVYTDKKEAGTALVEMCKEMKTLNVPATVGEYAGFKMAVSFDSFNHKFVMNLKGQLSHNLEIGSDPLGNIARINHALESMPKQLAEAQTKLETVERQLETAKVEVTKPFAQEAELAEKLERLAALNALLNMDEKGDEALGMEDAPEEENESQKTSGHDVQKSAAGDDSPQKPKPAAAMADKPIQRTSLKEKLEAFKVRAAGGNTEKTMPKKAKGKEEML